MADDDPTTDDDPRTNPFVIDFFKARDTHGPVAGSRIVGSEPPARPLKVRKHVGLLGPLDGEERRLYDGDDLESGVIIPDAAIVYTRRIAPHSETGLEMDVVYVNSDADLLYFSTRRPRRDRQPPGGADPDPFAITP